MQQKSGVPDDLAPLWAAATDRASPGKIVLIEEAFACLLRLRQVREELNSAALVVNSERSKMSRSNPLLTVETKLRDQLHKLWTAAGLSKVSLPRIPQDERTDR